MGHIFMLLCCEAQITHTWYSEAFTQTPSLVHGLTGTATLELRLPPDMDFHSCMPLPPPPPLLEAPGCLQHSRCCPAAATAAAGCVPLLSLSVAPLGFARTFCPNHYPPRPFSICATKAKQRNAA